MTSKIEVFHNLSEDAYLGLNVTFQTVTPGPAAPYGYFKRPATVGERHPLVKVFEYDPADLPGDDTLGGAFTTFNVGDDPGFTEPGAMRDLALRYRARRLRSLSVGDVIAVDGETWACEAAGWRPVAVRELNIVTDPAAAEAIARKRYQIPARERLTISVPWDAEPAAS